MDREKNEMLYFYLNQEFIKNLKWFQGINSSYNSESYHYFRYFWENRNITQVKVEKVEEKKKTEKYMTCVMYWPWMREPLSHWM